MDHPGRLDEHSFNGGKEKRPAPSTLLGSDVLKLLSNVENNLGKVKQKKKGKDSEDHGKRGLYSLNCLISNTTSADITFMSCILRKIFVTVRLEHC